eukprot:Lankesteria_metandrocarpae@DN3831_c0_g1_i1.p1
MGDEGEMDDFAGDDALFDDDVDEPEDDLDDLETKAEGDQPPAGNSRTVVETGNDSGEAPHSDGPRITSPYMTKFEKARVIGTRALQISMNAPVSVPLDGETDPLIIAEKELYAKSIPFIIRRYMPNGSYEDWSIEELIID